jgi:cytochrome b involved in lipid metabolism
MDDCWIIIHKKVINITRYLSKHPGGRWIILKYAGLDAT